MLAKVRIARLAPCCLLLIAAAGYWIGPKTDPENGDLAVEQSCLDFGEVWEDSQFQWPLHIHNRADRPIEVLAWSASCSCVLNISPKAFKLAPNQHLDVNLTLDLAQRLGSEAPLRDLNIKVSPQIKEGGVEQISWILRGTVRELLRPSIRTVVFPHLVADGSPWPETLFSVRAATALADLSADIDPTVARVRVRRTGKDDFEVGLTPSSSLAPGPFRAELRLVPRSTDGKLPAKRLGVSGTVRREVEAFPTSVFLGARRVGESIKCHLELKSLVGKEVKSSRATRLSSDTRVRSLAGNRYEIVQRIVAIGRQHISVLFSVEMKDGRTLEVPFEISYYGLDPQALSGSNV